MKYTVQNKALCLLSIILVHTALGSPVVKRDVYSIAGDDGYIDGVADQRQLSLYDADVFGGEAHENGAREKRLLKLKALGVGAGLKAAGAGLKTVGVLGAKAVGKTAIKAATTVGVKVAKAAITIGIAKLLLSLVFGKINQLIDFKTRLLGSSGSGGGLLSSSTSLSSGSGGGGGVGASASVNADDGSLHAEAGASVGTDSEGLLDIDPNKVSLQVPNEFISGGFNVVNRAAPVVGEVIQKTAQRILRVAVGLKPILGSSLGFKAVKRQVENSEYAPSEPEEESLVPEGEDIPAEPSSLRRSFVALSER
ncbi:uncharacterized protein LOC106662019 [Cimex lectularius]|uniref:Uncharacterized protein n=1 Tax=Cimex lectularius TaxID=79782 RepID=A0A8I6RF37_CIMLE|nr:uncharacterized protein LOC106662019 [Cimex lectularius]XP_014241301.1 uncharacterized protein LOC106662019 [Cimex lectularius]